MIELFLLSFKYIPFTDLWSTFSGTLDSSLNTSHCIPGVRLLVSIGFGHTTVGGVKIWDEMEFLAL